MHQQAVATEAGADVYRRLVDIADQMPLAAVRPNGEATIEDYEEADGARDEEAARAAAYRRADAHRPDHGGEPGRHHRGRRENHPADGPAARAAADDRANPWQASPAGSCCSHGPTVAFGSPRAP